MTGLEAALGVVCALVVVAFLGVAVAYAVHASHLKDEARDAEYARVRAEAALKAKEDELKALLAAPKRVGVQHMALAPESGGNLLAKAQALVNEMQILECSRGEAGRIMLKARELIASFTTTRVSCAEARTSSGSFAAFFVSEMNKTSNGTVPPGSTARVEAAAAALWIAMVDASCNGSGYMDAVKMRTLLDNLRKAVCPADGFPA